jgi:hypothetical protein
VAGEHSIVEHRRPEGHIPSQSWRFGAALLLLFSICSLAAYDVLPRTPTGFFSRLSGRLLEFGLGLSAEQIQIYPTNQYTPAVHRLLQLTANLYDATTNRFPLLNGTNELQAPTVFRPIFRRNPGPEATNIFIAGYREVAEFSLSLPPLVGAAGSPMVDLEDSADRTRIQPQGTAYQGDQNEVMVYGIPLVVGATKGFPNFNKFALQNAVTVARKLEFHRNGNGRNATFGTNQVFLLTISNSLGAQAWNSYSNAFARPVQVIVVAEVSLALTNEFGPISGPSGAVLTSNITFSASTNINDWPGFTTSQQSGGAFAVPLLTGCLFLTNSAFLHDQNRFVDAVTPDQANYFPVPRWVLSLKTRVRYMLIDSASGRILDYVNLRASEDPVDIMSLMRANAACGGNLPVIQDPDPGSLWCTNRIGNPTGQPGLDNPYLPTYGILSQIEISEGLPSLVSDSFWRNYNYNGELNDKQASIYTFVDRIFGDLRNSNDPEDIDFEAPFNPTRTLYQYVRWEANDPLVHYTVTDLTDRMGNTNQIQLDANTGATGNPVARLGGLDPVSDHYRPWGGNPVIIPASDPTRFLVSVKDPSVTRSDDWNFPSGEPLSLTMLGRIHRGTPWQTIYLKSAPVDLSLWKNWMGMTDDFSALVTMPTNDWRLVTLLGLILNTNNPRRLLSINNPDTGAWLEALDGLPVLTNSSPPVELVMSSNSPQAALIAAAIQQARSAQPNQQFSHLGDLLAIPQLSLLSPWLDTSRLNTPSAPTDEACEMIPSLLLPRLREDPVGSIVSAKNRLTVQFSGYDHCRYAIETSPDLVHWITVGTRHPSLGMFDFPLGASPKMGQRFYRSILLPEFRSHDRKNFGFHHLETSENERPPRRVVVQFSQKVGGLSLCPAVAAMAIISKCDRLGGKRFVASLISWALTEQCPPINASLAPPNCTTTLER